LDKRGEKTENEIIELSFRFSKRIVKLYRFLTVHQKEYVLSKQILRSGTSIGANVNEAQAAQSKNDFISKLSIASKEARETQYWLRLLIETDYLDQESSHVQSLSKDIQSINKILTSIILTLQQGK